MLLHRDRLRELRALIIDAEQRGDEAAAQEARNQFRLIESQIIQAFAESNQRRYNAQSNNFGESYNEHVCCHCTAGADV